MSAVASVSTSGVLETAMPAGLGGLDVDVVEADAEVGHQLGPARLGGEHLGGDLVGHGGEQRVRAAQRFLQAVRP